VNRSDPPLVIVRGGGDLGTGAARRLFLAGLAVLVTERSDPWCVRRRTAFAAALAEEQVSVDGVEEWTLSLTKPLPGLDPGDAYRGWTPCVD